MNIQEALRSFASDLPMLNARGIYPGDGAKMYLADEIRHDYSLAMDAVPALTTVANSGIPAFLTTIIDPEIYKVLFAPNKAAEILGERRKGSWVDETAMFPTVEHTGEVSTYGDYNENGRTGANTNFPQRQSYHFQTMEEYGDREIERAGLAKLNWVSEIEGAATDVVAKFMNLTYFYGVGGLQNYGLLNDPNLSAAITPTLKAWGGTAWISGGEIKATANEIFNDIQKLFVQLVSQNGNLVDKDSKLVLAMSADSSTALTTTNTFNVNVEDLLKKNFKNLRIVTAVQYGGKSATNPQGAPAGNTVQLWAENVEGQQTGYCAFTEKFRAFPVVRKTSSYEKKVMAGSWGAIIRFPAGCAQMVGV